MSYLIGKHIRLIKFTERHIIPKYVDWLNDQNINRFLCTGRTPVSKEDLRDRNDHHNIFFAIVSNLVPANNGCLVEEDCFLSYIGTISLNGIDWISRKGEIGYMIGEQTHWGRGLATEAVQLITDYALNRLNLNKVEAGVVDGNIGSIRALEKNGFKEYGVIPQEYWLEGKYYDVHRLYRLQEW